MRYIIIPEILVKIQINKDATIPECKPFRLKTIILWQSG